ncbi:MAG: PKD domain-containing protein [Flavobacterium sp.]|uniref:PKD domain-containing protein n=1 Tax=Flavobacterium sp. TaxID=239 RepID=UPI002B47F6E2|nr:PKD domain-containing protein [Flavobacterium sp.]WRH73263.1 MAG: PKD domain-containing protein [Flavobacterium sp.]
MSKQLFRVRQKIFFVLILASFLLLGSAKGYSQTNSGIAISWDKEVGCQTYNYDDRKKVFIEDIGESDCIRMCEQSVVHYTLTNLPAGATTTWSVGGGTLSNATNTSCTVSWGVVGTGSVSFTIVSGSTILSKTLCIEKIVIPSALFEIAPLHQYTPDDNIYLCRDQVINFINLSSANNGTSLISYHWVFKNNTTGTFTTSSEFQPSVAFTEDGEYKAILTVTNACNCTSEYVLKFKVKGRGFEISCPTVICEGQSSIYSLPFDGMDICHEHFNWTVNGGRVISEGGGNIEVLWDAVDSNGFGYVTFYPMDCRLDCLEPSTIKVPVIQTQGTIQGPTDICYKGQGRYKLPQWPTTDIQWEIVGNVNNDLGEIILTDQRNEVIVTPYTMGTITLRATYINTLLHCGGEAEFEILISRPLEITGEQFVCQNNSSVYTTNDGIPVQWNLRTNTGVTIYSASNSTTFSYTFNQSGSYILTATGAGYCAGEQKIITVIAKPSVPNGIDGTPIVCPNSPYTYSVQNPNPQANYVWSITNGTFLGSNVGNQVNVTFTGALPPSIEVRSEVYVPVACHSAPVVLPVTIQEINAEIVGAQTTVCANSVSTFQLNNLGLSTLYTDYDNVVWSISVPSLGSVSVGQNTTQISVNWNHTTITTPVTLTATITKCTLTEIVSIPITILGIPEISISGDTTICSGQGASFSITSLGYTFNPTTQVIWNFGYGDVIGTLNQNFTFSNTGTTNLLMPVTAYIVNPNGCTGTTNIANFNILVLPSPVATASLSSTHGNVFCSKYDINATLTAATGSASTIQWYFNDVTHPIPVSNGGHSTTLTIGMSNNLGFGNYFFIATYSNNCTYTSNSQYIIQKCGPPDFCELSPAPEINNNSNNQCGVITLTGTANPSPVQENFTVIGPINYSSVPQGFSFAATPGIYHIFYNTFYMCEGELSELKTYKKITVPYVAKLSHASSCGDDNTFNVTLFDQTSYYAAATGLTHSFEYSYNGGAWQPTSATLTNIPAGNYQFKIKVNGFVDGNAQPQCEYIITVSLQPIPDLDIVLLSDLDCHDSPVRFGLTGSGLFSITSFLWDFDDNGAQNTMSEPTRVFTNTGDHDVKVTVKNASGCQRTFVLDNPIIVPEPCFGGDITTTTATVCMGNVVTMHYVPSSTLSECTATQYQWMNGNTVVATTTVPTWSTSVNGVYWVRLKSALNCTYDTPSRVVPQFITPPSIKVIGATTLCVGDDFSLQAITSAIELTWTLDGVIQTAWNNQLTPVFTGLTVGNHNLEIIASDQVCSQSTTVVLSVVQPPQHVTITPQLISCTPYLIKLTATAVGGSTFNWSNGATGSTIIVTEGGPYKVTATAGGCSASTQLDLPKNPENYIWIFPTGCYTDCSTETNYLIGPNLPLNEWSWNKDAQSDTHGSESFADPYTLIKDGDYTLTINTGNCSLESEPLHYSTTKCDQCKIERLEIKEIKQNETPYCSYTYTLVIYSGFPFPYQVTLSDETHQVVLIPSTFTLQPGQNVIPITVIPQSPFNGGVLTWILQGTLPYKEGYELCITKFAVDVAGCDSTGKMASVDKNEVNSNLTSFSLYPNPAVTAVTLSYSLELEGATLEIYDLTGRSITKKALSSADKEVTLAIDSYPAGMYMFVVKQGDAILWQHKLIIK